ncbi:ankyrin repeat-containing protein [Anaeramoeba flamelloides]|uniref:Ankyrin repeat-containing protein n=1 Tax=Anaeramoeba flamelloides TaxID=1746091 RepID=A0AAV7ZGY5_9EUKA|nr:ankyrin repeat-containing protein [Anaeramoeba flamelloides]
MSGFYILLERHQENLRKFMSRFPNNVNSENINQKYHPLQPQAIHYLLESRDPQLKDLEYLISLGSDLNCYGGSEHLQPLGVLLGKHSSLRKDLVCCLFDHCPTKTILDDKYFDLHLEFKKFKERGKFQKLVEFLKMILIYWFEKEQEKEKEKEKVIEIGKEKEKNEKKKEKQKEKEKEKEIEIEKENEKNEKTNKKDSEIENEEKKTNRKLNTIIFILNCLHNKENITKLKELIENKEIILQYQDKKTNLNLLHALILSDKCDNLESKLEISKEIANQMKKSKTLYQQINWVNYCGLQLLALQPTKPKFTAELTRHLIKNGSNANIGDNYSTTPFYLHLQQEPVSGELIKIYLQNECKPVTRKDNPNFTIVKKPKKTLFQLFCSRECNDIEIYKLFLKSGADVKMGLKNDYQYSILNLICERKNPTLEIVKLLHESGAPIIELNTMLKKNTYYTTLTKLLYNSKCKEKYQILKYLINAGANISSRDGFFGHSILHYLCRLCNFPKFDKSLFFVLNKCKKHNLNLNSEDMHFLTPLHLLMKNYKNITLPFLKSLINDFDGDLNIKDRSGMPPVAMYIIENKYFNPKICNFCFENIGNQQYLHQTRDNNCNIVHSISESEYPSVEKLKYLFEFHNVDLNVLSKPKKHSPLHLICKNYKCTVEIIKFFIENGANINQLSNDNKTPLLYLLQASMYLFAKNERSHSPLPTIFF